MSAFNVSVSFSASVARAVRKVSHFICLWGIMAQVCIVQLVG